MDERLGAEVQIAQENLQGGLAAAQVSPVEEFSLPSDVQALIARCMNGSESYDDPFGAEKKYWHQDKFNTQHIQIIMLKVAGMKQTEIAEALNIDIARISVTLSHPYAKKIIRALIPQNVARVIDIRTRMEQFAGELMEHSFRLAIASTELKEVKDVTFGFLDRAGYNVVNKTATANVAPKDLENAGPTMMGRLAAALDESSAVDKHVMPNWKTPVPPDDSSMPSDGRVFEAEAPVSASSPGSATPGSRLQPAEGGSDPRGSQRTGTDN